MGDGVVAWVIILFSAFVDTRMEDMSPLCQLVVIFAYALFPARPLRLLRLMTEHDRLTYLYHTGQQLSLIHI